MRRHIIQSKQLSNQVGAVSSEQFLFDDCLPPTVYYLLPTAYCPLPTAHCLLPTTYCSLLTPNTEATP